MTPELLSETVSPGVLLLRLNRAEKRNALATPLLIAIAEALTDADHNDAVRAVVITGNDKVFAAGADLDELEASTSDDEIESPRFRAWATIRACGKPVISAVEGWCLGAGMELMMRTDLVIASKEARFGQPETNLGIIPGAGGTAILPRLIGQSLAMEMVLTGEPITAARALRSGLIARVVPVGQALETALELARRLASRAPKALKTAKGSILRTGETSLEDHLHRERRAFVALLSGAEKEEGIAAFREKREAKWALEH